jgi:phospholipase C
MARSGVIGFCAVFAACNATHAASIPTFKHIVIIIQENRTPDNLFGSNPHFEPGVDLATHGQTSTGETVWLAPLPLADCYDLGHTHQSFVDAFTQGFDMEPATPQKGCTVAQHPAYKYVENATGTVQPYFDMATQNGFANRMFQTNQGPSFPAHQFLFSGTSAPAVRSPDFDSENTYVTDAGCAAPGNSRVTLINPLGSETYHAPIYPCFEHPALSDLLDHASTPISWRYYAPSSNSIWTAPNAIRHICLPVQTQFGRRCTGPDWVKNVVPDYPAQVLTDIANCNLSSVSWVIPTGEESDHPSSNTGIGPAWVASIVNSIGAQSCGGESYWQDTAIFIVWDDWGGWFDHVRPFQITKPNDWGGGYTYGFRVPLLVVSAFTPPGTVSNAIFDFGSILAFTERNFGVGFVGSSAGTGKYLQYADYQATQPGRGDLAAFFGLSTPKPFKPINAPYGASYFIHAPRSDTPVDSD